MLYLAEVVSTSGENFNYLAGGYAIAFVILFLMVASLMWRYRSLAADEAALQQLEAEVEREKRQAVTIESRETATAR